jgi:hypothetical protein
MMKTKTGEVRARIQVALDPWRLRSGTADSCRVRRSGNMPPQAGSSSWSTRRERRRRVRTTSMRFMDATTRRGLEAAPG